MAKTGVTIEGLDKLEDALAKLSDVARSDTLVLALEVGAMPLVNEAKENAPVLSGTLQRSIHAEVQPTGNNSAQARVGTNVEYALAQEFGTARMEGKAYLRRAFDSEQQNVRDDIIATLRQAIREAL